MFLRNYDNIVILQQMSQSINIYGTSQAYTDRYIGTKSSFGDGNCNVRVTNGSTVAWQLNTSTSSQVAVPQFMTMASNFICLGDGNTPVTYEDYKLSGTIIDNTKLQRVSYDITYDETRREFVATTVHTYTNSTSNAITIKEWGIFYPMQPSGNSYTLYSNNSSTDVLTYREVLETPITIEPGTTATITFRVRMPMPNHP